MSMKKTFTINDLILFAYNELDEQEIKDISKAIEEDDCLKKIYNSFSKSKKLLDNYLEKPSDSVTNNILNLSKSLSILKPNNFRNVECYAN